VGEGGEKSEERRKLRIGTSMPRVCRSTFASKRGQFYRLASQAKGRR